MKKTKESIDIFKIYQESKLKPSNKQNEEIKAYQEKKNRNKTPLPKRNVKYN